MADEITNQDNPSTSPFWSRNGDRVFFTQPRQNELWSIAAIGGAPRRELTDVRIAALAPDGVSMAVARTGGLAFCRLGSSECTPYKQAPFDHVFSVRRMQFSPDGTKLAVLATRVNYTQGEIWLVPYPPGKGAPRRLFAGEGDNTEFAGLSWMPDNRHMVVSFDRFDEPEQLYLGDAETGKLRKLTTGMEARSFPAVSPDGRRIAYVQEARDSDLVEVMLDGSGVRPVLATARSELSGSWLPGGREFVFISDATGPFQLWGRSPADQRSRPLLPARSDTFSSGRLSYVTASPDGERLAVEVWGIEHTIWALRRSGGKAVRVDPQNSDHHRPSWSPDGNWIAYARALPQPQLMKVPSGGGTPVEIAKHQGQAGATEVLWSPANDWIAWLHEGITLYSPDGKQQKRLADAKFHESAGFSADGKTLYAYYLDRSVGMWVLEAIDVASGQSRRIGSLDVGGSVLNGFSLYPDGKRFLATLEKSNPDIVMLEGF